MSISLVEPVELTEQQKLSFRILKHDPDMKNTELWIRMQINNPDLPDELRKTFVSLLKHIDKLIPIGSARVGRYLRELARDGELPLALLPSKERQEIINQREEKFRTEYGKN